MPKKIILDVDTGSDDAVAIMTALGCEGADVVGICCVWGNLDVEDTTENTLRLVSALERTRRYIRERLRPSPNILKSRERGA